MVCAPVHLLVPGSVLIKPQTIGGCLRKCSYQNWVGQWQCQKQSASQTLLLGATELCKLQCTCHRLVAWLSSCDNHHHSNVSLNQVTCSCSKSSLDTLYFSYMPTTTTKLCLFPISFDKQPAKVCTITCGCILCIGSITMVDQI